MRNTETSGQTVVGGEVFTFTLPFALSFSEDIVFIGGPFPAIWALVGDSTIVGFIVIMGQTVPIVRTLVCTSFGFVD